MSHPAGLLGADGLGDALERLQAAVRPSAVVPGWATVDLDRAEGELSAAMARDEASRSLGHADDASDHGEARRDDLLGAAARPLRTGSGVDLVLLEPSREGPLAASLARFGEGVVVLYLVTDGAGTERARAAGFGLSSDGVSPFGTARRVLVGPPWGPHLLLVAGDRPAPAATIDR